MNWKSLIENIDPKTADEDKLNGLKVMLTLPAFTNMHELIKSKIAEIEGPTANPTAPISAFTLEPAKFYQTENGSIIFTTNGHEGCGDTKMWEVIVITGGYTDPDLDSDLCSMLYGSFKPGNIYFLDGMGRAVAAVDELHYPMHVIKELPKHKAIDSANR